MMEYSKKYIVLFVVLVYNVIIKNKMEVEKCRI